MTRLILLIVLSKINHRRWSKKLAVRFQAMLFNNFRAEFTVREIWPGKNGTFIFDEVSFTKGSVLISARRLEISISFRATLRCAFGLLKAKGINYFTPKNLHNEQIAGNGKKNMLEAQSLFKLWKDRLLCGGSPVARYVICHALHCKYGNKIFETKDLQLHLEGKKNSPTEKYTHLKIQSVGLSLIEDSGRSESVNVEETILDLQIITKHDSLLITDDSEGRVNSIPFNVCLDLCHNEKDCVEIILEVPDVPAETVARSLPKFLSKYISEARFDGSINFSWHFKFDVVSPLKHYFDSSIELSNFSGDLNGSILSTLHEPFCHDTYVDGKLKTTLLLGAKDDDFIPLASIPVYLVNAIICSEDPYFYRHRGIDKALFGLAVATNIAHRKYSRGGSTISMQVIRNLFLYQNKRISRKIEEIFLTWLMEEVAQVPKNRILEIYVNIIEWGPDIYGIKKASLFYFNKLPIDLSLIESLVLSYIIPRPKFFASALGASSLQLKNNLRSHIQSVLLALEHKGAVSVSEVDTIDYDIRFAGELGSLNLYN